MIDCAARRAPFLVAALVVLALAASYRPQQYGVWGDQMAYYLQANSLAFDGDLQFNGRDLERFRRHGWPETNPLGLFLREAEGRFYYSKPFLYSLAAVPFVWVAPVRGPIVLNALLWLILLEITFRWWRRFNGSARAATLAALAWIGSAAPFYIFVIHTDLMIPTLLSLGLYLWLTSRRPEKKSQSESRQTGQNAQAGIQNPQGTRSGPQAEAQAQQNARYSPQAEAQAPQSARSSPSVEIQNPESKIQNQMPVRSIARIPLSGVFFGLAVYEKNPLFFFFAAALASLLCRREWKAAGLLCLPALIAFSLPTAVHIAQNGEFSPYMGNRVYCDATFPFDDLDKAREQLSEHRHPGSEFFEPRRGRQLLEPANLGRFVATLPPKVSCYLVGRKTGLFPYLTPALVAVILWLLLRQWRSGHARDTRWIAAGLCAYILFYFFILSAYYGGPTAIGNRYALQVFPAFLLLAAHLPRTRARFGVLVAVLVGAALFFPGPDLLKPFGKVRDNIDLFQKPRFRWLPFEWHLAWFMADKPSAAIGLGHVGQAIRLTDLNPTEIDYAYFLSSPRHRVALLSHSRIGEFLIRLTARARPHAGWLEGGGARVAFSLQPYQTRVYPVPLSPRRRARYRTFDVYCYRVEIATTSPLEANTIYRRQYGDHFGPFVQWIGDPRTPLPEAGIVPDDPRDAGPLLWGWHALEKPDAEGARVRWAGEATESAVVVPLDAQGPSRLAVQTESVLAMETEAVWNGRSLGKCVIEQGRATAGWTVPAALLRRGDNVLCLRHERLWLPVTAPGSRAERDDRWLSVHYLRLDVGPAPAAPEAVPAPPGQTEK